MTIESLRQILRDLGYDLEQIQRIMTSEQRQQKVDIIAHVHTKLIENQLTHSNIVHVVTKDAGNLSLETLSQLIDLFLDKKYNYTPQMLVNMAGHKGGSRNLSAALDLTDQFLEKGYTEAKISRIASREGGSGCLMTIIELWDKFIEKNYSEETIYSKVCSTHGSAQRVRKELMAAGNLNTSKYQFKRVKYISKPKNPIISNKKATSICSEPINKNHDSMSSKAWLDKKHPDLPTQLSYTPTVEQYDATRKIIMLRALGYTDEYIKVIFKYSHFDLSTDDTSALHYKLIDIGYSHDDIVRILASGRAWKGLENLLTKTTRLMSINYSIQLIVNIVSHKGGLKNLEAVFQLTEPFLKKKYTVEMIARIASQDGGSRNLRTFLELEEDLRKKGFTQMMLLSIAGSHGGSKNVRATHKLTDSLLLKKFTLIQIVRMAATSGGSLALERADASTVIDFAPLTRSCEQIDKLPLNEAETMAEDISPFVLEPIDSTPTQPIHSTDAIIETNPSLPIDSEMDVCVLVEDAIESENVGVSVAIAETQPSLPIDSEMNVVSAESEAVLSSPAMKTRRTIRRAQPIPLIDLSDINAVNVWAKKQGFSYIHSKTSTMGMEHTLMVAPVSVLGTEGKRWGVYTKKPIKKSTLLGEYLGKTVMRSTIKNLDYFFQFENDSELGIDSRTSRNWTAMVNSAPSYALANVDWEKTDGHIFYRARCDLDSNDQLLIYYGDEYCYQNMRFLHPKQNYNESEDIFQDNQASYHTKHSRLPAAFAALFNISGNQLFKVPDPISVLKDDTRLTTDTRSKRKWTPSHSMDVPYLAVECHGPGDYYYFPQHDQENITTLMLAGWAGDVDLIHALLNEGANPRIQSSIHGFSALHLIVLAEHLTLDVKKNIIEALLRKGALLQAQDSNNRSILHISIQQNDIFLLDFILEKNKRRLLDDRKFIFDCQNIDGLEPLVYALSLGHVDIAQRLFSQMTVENMTVDRACIHKQLTNLPNDSQKTAIMAFNEWITRIDNEAIKPKGSAVNLGLFSQPTVDQNEEKSTSKARSSISSLKH